MASEKPVLTEHHIQLLVAKAAKGDHAAFESLYEHFFTQVYKFCAFRLPKEVAEDVTADAFVKVWENLHGYRPHPKVPFAAWLFRIVRNQVIDVYRGAPVTEEMPEDIADTDAFNRADHRLSKKQLLSIVRTAVEKLPERYRDVLLLTYISELPTHEVARVLKLTEGGVRILRFRALKKLETLLPEDLPFTP